MSTTVQRCPATNSSISRDNSGCWASAEGRRLVTFYHEVIFKPKAKADFTYKMEREMQTLVEAIESFDSVPFDPYSGRPFGYDPERRIIWSVGEDGLDGQGDGWIEVRDDPDSIRWDLPDPAWLIPPIPPR